MSVCAARVSAATGAWPVHGSELAFLTLMQTRTTSHARTNRLTGLKSMLEERRAELATKVYGRMREARSDGATDRGEVLDLGESSEASIQQEIDIS